MNFYIKVTRKCNKWDDFNNKIICVVHSVTKIKRCKTLDLSKGGIHKPCGHCRGGGLAKCP